MKLTHTLQQTINAVLATAAALCVPPENYPSLRVAFVRDTDLLRVPYAGVTDEPDPAYFPLEHELLKVHTLSLEQGHVRAAYSLRANRLYMAGYMSAYEVARRAVAREE